jgi:hypothetical protein
MPVITTGDGLEKRHLLYNADRNADPIVAPTLRCLASIQQAASVGIHDLGYVKAKNLVQA